MSRPRSLPFLPPAILLICAAQTTAVWGEHALFYTGLPLWAYDHLGGTRGVTLALVAVNVPALLSLPAGVLVGSVSPRHALIACAAARLALIVSLLFCAAASGPKTATLLLSAAVLLVDSFFMPALKSGLPQWVQTDDGGVALARANGLLEATDAPGFLFGPPLGALLYARRGLLGPVLAQTAAYALALPLLLAAGPPAKPGAREAPPPPATMPLADPARIPGSLVVSWMAAATALGLTEALLLPYVREVLRRPETVYGLLGGLVGAGITLGAFLWSLPSVVRRYPPARRFFGAQALAGAALAAFGWGRSLPVCGVALLLGGIGFVGVQMAMTTLLQAEPNDRRRAGALGLAHTIEAAGVLVGAALAPLLSARFGLPVTLATAGAALALPALLAALRPGICAGFDAADGK